MGLDQYIEGLDKEFYWRKHARLQKFMSKEHAKQNPKDKRNDTDLEHLGFNGDSKNPNVNIEYHTSILPIPTAIIPQLKSFIFLFLIYYKI